LRKNWIIVDRIQSVFGIIKSKPPAISGGAFFMKKGFNRKVARDSQEKKQDESEFKVQARSGSMGLDDLF